MTVKYQSRSSKLTLAITSQPTTTEYIAGDTLSLTGLVVTATRRDGTPVNVTSQCTFSPANGSTLSSSGTQTITATYQGKKITTTVSVYALSRIAITTPPTKTAYKYGDTINYSGMVVKAYANNDNIVRTITSECTKSPTQGTTLSSTGSFSATISWRTKSTTQSYSVTALIYGAEWAGGSSSAWTRTDDAVGLSNPSPAVNNGNGSSPFDNIMPWSGMVRETDSLSNVLVKIPKFYYKWTRTGVKMKLQISMTKVSGFYTSPAHANRGDGKGERDYVYVGAYHCCDNTYSFTHYRSRSGYNPIANITRATARAGIHSLGNTYWQWDLAMVWTIRMLYLVEYADWNSQAKIGYGLGDSSLSVTGKTDGMVYHTGTNATTRASQGHVRYRYIEDLWANATQWIDGIYFAGTNNASIYAIKNPSNFSDTANGVLVGTRPTTGGVITSWTNPSASGYEYALYTATVSSSVSQDEYICDNSANNSSGQVVLGGGSYDQGKNSGLFQNAGGQTASGAMVACGCRLMKLP